jgi:hypothetical protein
VVGHPFVPTVPVAALTSSSECVGRCDDLILDASAPSGTGGRDMVYHFSADSLGGGSIVNLTAALDAINAGNGGKGLHRAVVPSAAMVPGASFQLAVSATNFLGFVDTTTIRVSKLRVPAPIIKIQGGTPQQATHSASLSLQVTADLPKVTCVGQVLSSSKVSFVWYEDTGKFTGPLRGTSKNQRMLNIAPGRPPCFPRIVLLPGNWILDG